MSAGIFSEDFLLDTDAAQRLYHEYAEPEPIFDYHCHLPPEPIAQRYRFRSLTELWLEADHYKWRAMRAHGISERYLGGPASDWEKFQAWAETVPHALRNPLYHWTHLELKHPFGIRRWLDPGSAREIYERANELLAREEFSALGLLRAFRVVVLCTSDDPTSRLEHHREHNRSPAGQWLRIYPTWRPDAAFAIDHPDAYNSWLDSLAKEAQVEIQTYDDLLLALDRRHEFFHQSGCRLSDHGFESTPAEDYQLGEVRTVFCRARSGQVISPAEAARYRSALLYELALLNHRRGWAQQLHLGALRNTSTRLLLQAGPDSGHDSIGDFEQARPLARFLDRLDREGRLAPTIIYNSNPRDTELFSAMIGNFQDGSRPGKLQHGPAWWFLDQLDGMRQQLNALSNLGLLAHFVGMTTDSRSFLSYSRHEYFRRLLCRMLGRDLVQGLLPHDFGLVGSLVRDLCFRNAARYFGLELPQLEQAPTRE